MRSLDATDARILLALDADPDATVVALAAASLTDRRAVATAGLLGVMLGTSALANILFFTAQFDGKRWVAFLSLSGLPGRFVDWLFGASFDPGTLADQAGFTGPGYLVAMAVVAAAAAVAVIVLLRPDPLLTARAWAASAADPTLAFGGLIGCVVGGPLIRRVGHARLFA